MEKTVKKTQKNGVIMRIDAIVHRALKIRAAIRGLTLSETIAELLKDENETNY